MEKLSFKCQTVYAVENFLRPPQKISAVWLFAFFETPRELCVFFWIETHVQFGGYDNRALVVGGSSPFGNPPTVLPPARQDGDRHHRHRHRHHHHLTSSSDQLDRLENSLALEMVLVKRGEYGGKSWEENEVSCSECFIYLKGLRHTAFPSIALTALT